MNLSLWIEPAVAQSFIVAVLLLVGGAVIALINKKTPLCPRRTQARRKGASA